MYNDRIKAKYCDGIKELLRLRGCWSSTVSCPQAAGMVLPCLGTPFQILLASTSNFFLPFSPFILRRQLLVYHLKNSGSYELCFPGTVLLQLIKNYWWNETVKCHLGCSQAHFSLLQLHSRGIVEMSTWRLQVKNIITHASSQTQRVAYFYYFQVQPGVEAEQWLKHTTRH